MKIDPHGLWSDILTIREFSPLIHNITNYVVMEQTANALLALGASPVMAHASDEAEDMAKIAHSLVLNIGTLSPSWIEGMFLALKMANYKNIPSVFDPVGAGATPYRTNTAKSILACGKLTAIRGNASEILALAGCEHATKGVDSSLQPLACLEQAKELAKQYRCIVSISGEVDLVTNGDLCFTIHNGDPIMTKVTGMGCTATAVTGAFLAIQKDSLLGCIHAAALMGIAGEMAAEKSKGPGSFKIAFVDALSAISLDEIKKRMRVK